MFHLLFQLLLDQFEFLVQLTEGAALFGLAAALFAFTAAAAASRTLFASRQSGVTTLATSLGRNFNLHIWLEVDGFVGPIVRLGSPIKSCSSVTTVIVVVLVLFAVAAAVVADVDIAVGVGGVAGAIIHAAVIHEKGHVTDAAVLF